MDDDSDSTYSDISTSSSTIIHRICNETTGLYERKGRILFRTKDLSWKRTLRKKLFFPNSSTKNVIKNLNLPRLLNQREFGTNFCIIETRLRFHKKLYEMNIRLSIKDFVHKKTKFLFEKINKKNSIYLGLSHDTNYLIELSIDVSDETSMTTYFDRPSADESTFRLIVHHLTPVYLYPCHVLDLGRRPTFSVFYAGFSSDQNFFASHSFNSNEQTDFSGTYSDSVSIDMALLKQNIHVLFKLVVNYNEKKRKLCQKSYFRIFKNGILFDTGSEIVAVLFSDKCPNEPNQSQLTYKINKIDVDYHSRTDGLGIHGIFLRDIFVRTCSLTIQNNSFNTETSKIPHYKVEIVQPNELNNENELNSNVNSKKTHNSSTIFMSETYLNAERVITAVLNNILKKRFQNSKFMGITGAESYIVGVCDQIAQILVIGVIEVQMPTRYVFLRLSIELNWNLNKPNKTSMVNLSVKEIPWRTATLGAWQPEKIPICLNFEDRLLTNDVVDSLNWLTGSYSGGFIFSL